MSDELTTASSVDLNRYVGTWFEICRLPLKWEDEHAQDITATYSINEDGSVRVDNRCIGDDGKPQQAIGNATATDESNAKLLVSFLPEYLRWIPFTKGDYWIIRLTDDYTVSLVGTPDRKNLWLLAREHRIDQAVHDDFMATAVAEGFDLSQLITPAQSGRVVEIPADQAK